MYTFIQFIQNLNFKIKIQNTINLGVKRVYQPALMVPGKNEVLAEPIIVLPVSSASCMKIYEYNLWYINTIMFILFKVFL